VGYVQPLSRVVKLDFYGECFFRFGPGRDGQNVLAAPGGVAFVKLEIGASARPLVALFLDEVDLGGILDGIDAEAFLGRGSDQRAVLGVLLAGLKLCLSHTSSLLSCKGAGFGST